MVQSPVASGPVPTLLGGFGSAEMVARPRLMRLMQQRGYSRVTLVKAPPGYGKSCLLAQMAESQRNSGRAVAWLGIDFRDKEPHALFRRLLSALRQSGLEMPESPVGSLSSESFLPLDAAIAGLCDGLRGRDVCLFIDDLQLLKDSAALDYLRMLIESAPPELQIVLSSREEVGLPLSRLRVLGELHEIGIDELKFTADEIADFLGRAGLVDLSAADLSALEERSEGWAVALRLFTMALRGTTDVGAMLAKMTGELRQIADFFSEEVLTRQPAEIQDFVMKTAFFHRFCPEMAEKALGISGGVELLAACEGAGLFLISLDEVRNWYRYHHLFGEFLRRRFRDRAPDAVTRLYRNASEWHLDEGQNEDAFDYALLADDAMRAAEILDGCCEAMWAAGRQRTIQSMGTRLPADVLAQFPRIMLILAWRAFAEWRFEDARHLIATTKARLAELELQTPRHPDLDKFRLLVQHRESQIAHASNDLGKLEQLCSAALSNTSELARDPYLHASFLNSLQYAQRERLKIGHIDRHDAMARELVARTGSRQGEVFIAMISGPSFLLAGRAQKAAATLEAGLKVAEELAGHGAPLGSLVALPLARVYYEQDRIDQAEALVDAYLHRATVGGMIDPLVAGWVTRARLLRLKKNPDGALAALEEAADFGRRLALERLLVAVNAEKLRLLLHLGRPDEAESFARRSGLSAFTRGGEGETGEAHAHGQGGYSNLDGNVALGSCRLLAAQDRIGDALAIARQWRTHAANSQVEHLTLQWDIALAELLYLSGDQLAAQRALQKAVARGHAGQFYRSFIDEGEPVLSILRQLSAAAPHTPSEAPELAFLREIIARSRPEGEQARTHLAEGEIDPNTDLSIFGKVNRRELEVLSLAASGMQNRQIARKLGLTEGTVKWYLQQIFDKLGIRERYLAAQRARQLGLIP